MKNIFAACMILGLFGCATISSSDISGAKPDYNAVQIEKEKRKDITFSVSVHQQMSDHVFLSTDSMAEKIKDVFKESKLFGKVHWVPKDEPSNHHYHFDIKVTGTDESNQMLAGTLSGLTLTLIPVFINYDIDITMFVTKKGKEVYSSAVPVSAHDVIWAPFLVLSPFLNHGTIGMSIKSSTMNHFMSEIIDNKLYR